MKIRFVCIALFSIAFVGMMAVFVHNAIPLSSERYFLPDDACMNGIDFRLRINEVKCLRGGVDPYLVYVGFVPHDKYYPLWKESDFRTTDRDEPVNAYPPWEYVLMSPLSWFSNDVAWWIYYGLMALAEFVVLWLAFGEGRLSGPSVRTGFLCAAAALSLWIPVYSDTRFGNYGVIISAAIMGMAAALRCGHDFLAGILLSVAMIKPQLSVLLVIPLIFKRRYMVIGVATCVCAVGSLIASFWCGSSPVKMILEAPAASAHAFAGCALIPSAAVELAPSFGIAKNALIVAGLCVGALLCVFLSWRLRKTANWLMALAPAVFLSVAWTYNSYHNYCVFALVCVAMMIAGLSSKRVSIWSLCLIVVAAAMRFDLVLGRLFEYMCVWIGMAPSGLVKLVIRDSFNLLSVLAFVLLVLQWDGDGSKEKAGCVHG